VEETYEEVQSDHTDEGHAAHDGDDQKGKAKRTEDISGFIDKWETKVLALSRDFKETLSEKMRAAILISMLPPELQNTLVQQADKITDYKTTKDKIIGIVEAKLALKDPDSMDVDAVRPPEEQTPYPYVQEHDHCEHLDIDAMGKGGFQCYRCGGQGHVANKCATPSKGKGKAKGFDGKAGKASCKGDFGKNPGGKVGHGKGGGEWQGFCSYCGKPGHGPRDCWSKQKDERHNQGPQKMNVGNVDVEVSGFDIGCVEK
jgi:hypothetical protein